MNQSLLDPNPSATESLFQPPYQEGRASGVIINEVARCHAKSMDGMRGGTQSIFAGKHIKTVWAIFCLSVYHTIKLQH